MVKQLRKSRCKNTVVPTSRENRRRVSHTPSTAANISTEKSGAKRCFVANTFAAIVFIFAHIRAYALAPLRFSCDAETTIFPHRDLRNYFTIRDELANEKPTSTGHQGYFRDGEPVVEIRAKYLCHLRNEDCFLRKTAIATAIEVDHLAQAASAFAEMKLSL